MTGPKELLEDGQEEVFSQTAVERGLAFDPPAMSEEDIRAADLATALAAIVQQIDISDYRDKRGNTAKNNVAFIHAQQLVDRYGCTHDQICEALERYGDDMATAARRLAVT